MQCALSLIMPPTWFVNILFYAGDVFGFFGWSFMELVMHNYAEEVTSQQPEAVATQDV